jgi:hypothetical protein
MVQDQCVQEVGDVRVTVDASTGLWAQWGASSPFQVDATPPFTFSGGASACAGSHDGPVQPCLSPDGLEVAYVAQGDGGLLLRVHELPDVADMASVIGGPAALGTAALESPSFVTPSTPGPGVTAPSLTTPAPIIPMEARLTPDGSRPFLAFDFYGDTPSLAWSPDSGHLAFNAAFAGSAYREDWDPMYTTFLSELGLFVMDAGMATVQRVASEQRYHPSWLGNDRVASACSVNESCTSGLALTELDGTTTMATRSSVFNTAAMSDHEVLYFAADTYSWDRVDTDTSATVSAVAPGCSWEPPPELAQDQCIQEVGDVRVWVQLGTGLYSQVGSNAPVRLDPSPPWVLESGYAYACRQNDHSGPIQPCLSPDGQRVAYVTRSISGLSLHVHDVPR